MIRLFISVVDGVGWQADAITARITVHAFLSNIE
jgi:hypothetical protein